MSDVNIKNDSLKNVANTIRKRAHSTDTFYPSELSNGILNINPEYPLYGTAQPSDVVAGKYFYNTNSAIRKVGSAPIFSQTIEWESSAGGAVEGLTGSYVNGNLTVAGIDSDVRVFRTGTPLTPETISVTDGIISHVKTISKEDFATASGVTRDKIEDNQMATIIMAITSGSITENLTVKFPLTSSKSSRVVNIMHSDTIWATIKIHVIPKYSSTYGDHYWPIHFDSLYVHTDLGSSFYFGVGFICSPMCKL